MIRKNLLVRSFFQRFKAIVISILVAGFIWMVTGWLPVFQEITLTTKNVSAASDPVIAAAGDIACDPGSASFNGGNGTSSSCRQKYTSDLLVNAGLSAVLDLGDNQYYCGGYQAFLQSYDLSWGRVKPITHPAVGNHEYLTSGGTGCTTANTGAAGYFQYFGAAAGNPSQGYYSYDIGTWHLIALNSNCSSAGGCGATSPQGKWLEADLSAHSNFCVLAYWHIPLFSSGGRASTNSKPFWTALYNHNADLILVGHDHIYERFAPQTPSGIADPVRGIRQFTVGTGGADHTSITTVAANSELINTNTFGVLKLTLHPDSYDWQFVPEAGKTFTDSGTTACHGSTPSPTSTATPTSTPTQTPTPVSSQAATPTATDTPASTSTATPDLSATSTSTATPDLLATSTATPTSTATSTPTLPPTPTPTATTSTSSVLTFNPTDDTYVEADKPDQNFGASSQVGVDNSPIIHMLLKFTVSGVGSQKVTSAKLRLYCVNLSGVGGDFYPVADTTWSEKNVTWNTAPTSGTTSLGKLGAVAVGSWYELDVTSLVTGDGTYSLQGISSSSDGAYYSSKEGANPPQLVITVSP